MASRLKYRALAFYLSASFLRARLSDQTEIPIILAMLREIRAPRVPAAILAIARGNPSASDRDLLATTRLRRRAIAAAMITGRRRMLAASYRSRACFALSSRGENRGEQSGFPTKNERHCCVPSRDPAGPPRNGRRRRGRMMSRGPRPIGGPLLAGQLILILI